MRDVNLYNRNQPQVNFYIIAFFYCANVALMASAFCTSPISMYME